ncbi:hypothetical protein [Pelagicoccus albus]|uniref:Uncharacterized protein n=1 Tax=Pelagicoccus albus TaxID=415222 RepID=A0A7X1E6W4_9BACT|nr:hypothetical protein [Pelagicoccus albus]MBC2604699.1 hypothetical protein [Pelagicoccus albus]
MSQGIVATVSQFWRSPWSLVLSGIVIASALSYYSRYADDLAEADVSTENLEDADSDHVRSTGKFREVPNRSFVAKPKEAPRTTVPETVTTDKLVVRQLDRHARLQELGYYSRILDNPNTHPKIRQRIQAEYDRLEQLAGHNRQLLAFIRSSALPPPLDEQGRPKAKLSAALKNMKETGAWEDIHQSYVAELERLATDPSTPSADRPTEDYIKMVKEGGILPIGF